MVKTKPSSGGGGGGSDPNFQNRTLFHGDNLEFLRGINSNTVDLIATDPPFNKGKDFHATPDSVTAGASFHDRWKWDSTIESWANQLIIDHRRVRDVIMSSRNSYGNDMGAFLCYMAVRLLAMKRVLKKTGSIYLHCDPTASHYLKELMDSIFGKNNFRNEIIWKRTNTTKQQAGSLGTQHDVIFWYSKSNDYCYNPPKRSLDDKSLKPFVYDDNDGRGRYQSITLVAKGLQSTAKRKSFEFKGITAQWLYSLETLEEWWKDNRIIKTKNGYRKKDYLSDKEKRGNVVSDLWVDSDVAPIQGKESLGYPTQKPISLYERMINISSNKGDIVLDPFCGCATTLIAAEKLERQWIGMDIWDKAHQTVIDRLKEECYLEYSDEERADLILAKGKIIYVETPPKRTDGGETATKMLKPTIRTKGDVLGMTKDEKRKVLLEMHKRTCQGCDYEFPHDGHLEIDHINPRSQGGKDDLENLTLLCSPCNNLKRDLHTLKWLREENGRLGRMSDQQSRL